MKPILISSAIALIIGFIGGWAIKSADQDLESFSPDKVIASVPPSKPRSDSSPVIPERETPPAGTTMPKGPRPMPNPPAELPETSEAEERAKWMRLSELLDLSTDQSKAIEAAITENRPDQTGETSPNAAVRTAGEQLQVNILATLTPEQQQSFRELQDRSRRNMIESRAQKSLSDELGNIDLDGAQREQVLDLIRSREEQETASISNATRLLLTNSFLPVGNDSQLTEDGILTLDLLANAPAGQENSFEALMRQRQEQIESRMSTFEDILTPAQMTSYRLSLEESLANFEKIRTPY